MKAVWDACESAGVAIPIDVQKFFGFQKPIFNQQETSLHDVADFFSDKDGGFVVTLNVSDIPTGTIKITFSKQS